MRQRQTSDRAKTPDHYDSALWHDLPDDIRQHLAAGDASATSWFADGAETFARVGAAPTELVGQSPAAAMAPRTNERLKTVSRATRQLSDSISGGTGSSDPLAAAREFHERISHLTKAQKEQARQANVEAAEYASRGGRSLDTHSKTSSYEADRLHRANQQHRSEMAQARADLTAKWVTMDYFVSSNHKNGVHVALQRRTRRSVRLWFWLVPFGGVGRKQEEKLWHDSENFCDR
jgi:hypothetical protein